VRGLHRFRPPPGRIEESGLRRTDTQVFGQGTSLGTTPLVQFAECCHRPLPGPVSDMERLHYRQ